MFVYILCVHIDAGVTYTRFADYLCANMTHAYSVPTVQATCAGNGTTGFQTLSCLLPTVAQLSKAGPPNFFTTAYGIPVILSAVIGFIGLLFLLKRYNNYQQLRKLPIHRALRAIKVSEARVLDAISKYTYLGNSEDEEGNIAIELAIKRNMNALVLYELSKYILPIHPDTYEPIDESIHQYAWIKLIQKDSNIEAVEIILDTYPVIVRQLSDAKDPTGRTALNLASPKCEQAIRESLYFMKRYE